MKTHLTAALAAFALLLSACTHEAGTQDFSHRYGEATSINQFNQIAYKEDSARLRDLSEDFRAKTQDTVNFAFNRANIDASARKALDGQAAWLKANPSVKMTIIGHTDLVGSERYNDRLGLRRARAALNYLVRRGVARNRLQAIESRGEREPVVQTEERERRNRRSVTLVSGFGRYYVGTGLDGEYAARVYDTYQSRSFGVSEAQAGVN